MRNFGIVLLAFSGLLFASQASSPLTAARLELLWQFDTGG
jgi:hypothetical protein